jgi:AraC-like DNA-binding protein
MQQKQAIRAEFEKIIARGKQSFFWQYGRGIRFVAPYHYHPEYELFFIKRGHGQRLAGHSIASFGTGELVFLGPNVPHVWMVAPGCKHVEAFYIQFLPSFMGEGFFDHLEMHAIRKMMETSRRGLLFSPSARREVASLLESFPTLNETERLIALLTILHRLSRDTKARPLGGLSARLQLNQRQEKRINLIFQYLNQNLTQPISQADVANHVHLSTSAFSRFFKRATRKCFMDVVHELRIAQVCQRLGDPDASIAEIAFACGYETLSHFNRQFRRIMKMTPRQYRRQMAGLLTRQEI